MSNGSIVSRIRFATEARTACPLVFIRTAKPSSFARFPISKKFRVRQWLASGQRHVDRLHLPEVFEQLVVLLEVESFPGEAQVVVTEGAIEVASVRELDHGLQQSRLVPSSIANLAE